LRETKSGLAELGPMPGSPWGGTHVDMYATNMNANSDSTLGVLNHHLAQRLRVEDRHGVSLKWISVLDLWLGCQTQSKDFGQWNLRLFGKSTSRLNPSHPRWKGKACGKIYSKIRISNRWLTSMRFGQCVGELKLS
jgi:hypothetical protein